MAEQDVLKIETTGRIRTLRLHRPSQLNALSVALAAALSDGIRVADADGAIDIIVITGSETVFTAGADLAEALSAPELGADAPAVRLFHTLAEARKPIIAGVAGPAVGAGCTMLFLCDMVVADKTAQMSMPFSRLGLCSEAGASFMLPALVGHQKAAELLMMAEPLDALRAERLGLVARVVPEGEVLAEAQALAEALLKRSQASLRAVKALLRSPIRDALRTQIDTEWAEFRALFGAPDAREAFAAFVEKRKPSFAAE